MTVVAVSIVPAVFSLTWLQVIINPPDHLLGSFFLRQRIAYYQAKEWNRPTRPKASAKAEALVPAGTIMSNPHRSYLPPEILDYIIDLLYDERKTLKECCLVSKSWVPRTRKHLFAEVEFQSAAELESWKKTFPDQSNSPAHYTHTLMVGCPEDVTVADVEQGGWIRSFSRVVKLVVYSSRGKSLPPEASLIPFPGFSPVLKCLDVHSNILTTVDIFALISSLPLLEDLGNTITGSFFVRTNPDGMRSRGLAPTAPLR